MLFFLSFVPPPPIRPLRITDRYYSFTTLLTTFVGKFPRIVNYAPRFLSELLSESLVSAYVHNAGTASTEIKFSNWNLIVGAGGGIRRNRAKHSFYRHRSSFDRT